MSGKQEKKKRRLFKKEIGLKINDVVEEFKRQINNKPFKARLLVAYKIISKKL